MGEINSHIQMPKLILKNFVNANKKFYYYDVKKSIVGNNGTPKSINTEKGYYSDAAEEVLNKELETKLSDLITHIDTKERFISFTKDQIDLVKRYLYSLLTREPSFRDSLLESSVYFDEFPEQLQNDVAAVEGMRFAEKDGLLDFYNLTIWKNDSDCPFVLPICGAYEISIQKCSHIIMPVSPQKAFVLFDYRHANPDLFFDKGVIVICTEQQNAEIILTLNQKAFQTQCGKGWGFVISNQRAILEQLLNSYKDIEK